MQLSIGVPRARQFRDFAYGTFNVVATLRTETREKYARCLFVYEDELYDQIEHNGGKAAVRSVIEDMKRSAKAALLGEDRDLFRVAEGDCIPKERYPLWNPATCSVSPPSSKHRPSADDSASPNGAD